MTFGVSMLIRCTELARGDTVKFNLAGAQPMHVEYMEPAHATFCYVTYPERNRLKEGLNHGLVYLYERIGAVTANSERW